MLSLTSSLSDLSKAITQGSVLDWFEDQRDAMEGQLDYLRKSCSASRVGSVEECCCLATIMYAHTVVRLIPTASATHTSLVTELKHALLRADLERLLVSNFKFWVWVVFIGYSS
jgi:hypothetical protein